MAHGRGADARFGEHRAGHADRYQGCVAEMVVAHVLTQHCDESVLCCVELFVVECVISVANQLASLRDEESSLAWSKRGPGEVSVDLSYCKEVTSHREKR